MEKSPTTTDVGIDRGPPLRRLLERTSGGRIGARLVMAVLLATVLAFVVIPGPGATAYNFDTWAYYELSENVFRDFYRIWTFRSYFTTGSYSASYPPLYPVLIGLVDHAAGLRWWSGLPVNAVSVAGIACANAAISRRLTGSRRAGLVATLVLLCFLPFSAEISGARSHPTALMLLSFMALTIVDRERLDIRHGLILGALNALAILTRYDWELPAALIGLLLLVWTRRPLVGVAYCLSALVVLSPWMAYCLERFGVPLASDSNWIAAALHGGFWSTDYYPPPGPERLRGPMDLVGKLVENRAAMAELARDFGRHASPLVVGAAVVLAIYRGVWGGWPGVSPVGLTPGWRRLFGLLIVWLAIVFGVWLTGYASVRYLSGLAWQVSIIGCCLAAACLDGADARQWRRLSLVAAAVFGAYGIALACYLGISGHGTRLPLVHARNAELAACLRAAGATPEQTVLFDDDELFAVEFGALEHWRSAVPPHNLPNMPPASVSSLLDRFGVAAIVGASMPNLAGLTAGEALAHCPGRVMRVARSAG